MPTDVSAEELSNEVEFLEDENFNLRAEIEKLRGECAALRHAVKRLLEDGELLDAVRTAVASVDQQQAQQEKS